MLLRRALLLAVVSLAPSLACACSDSAPAGSPTPPASTAAPDAGSGDAAPTRPAACVEQDATLQAALDGARKSTNAMLAVTNDACGTSVYLSGDPASASAASLWRVGSVTKTYVAATILTLVRDAKVSLDDPLAKWVPSVPKTDGVTVRMLLNHTSGIFNYTEVPAFFADPKKKWTPREIVDLATANEPYFAPGKSWQYSNTNYVLLGMIAEKAGGAKVSALIRARALEPAGLTHTFLDGEEPLVGALATGFSKTGKDVTQQSDMSGPWTAGAMAASGADLCDWVARLFGERKVLGEAELKLMIDDSIKLGFTQQRYGLGVMISNGGPAGVGYGHGGDISGFHTDAAWYPDKRTAVCAVVNQDGADPNAITSAALKALF